MKMYSINDSLLFREAIKSSVLRLMTKSRVEIYQRRAERPLLFLENLASKRII